MRTVLIPLDGSELGEGALSYLLEQMPKTDVRVLLLHCVDYNYVYANATMLPRTFPEIEELEQRRYQEYLDKQAERLREQGYEVSAQIAHGEPVDRILAVAEAQNVDQILLSTHGRTGLKRLFMGSVAEGVIRRTPVPVLVAPVARRGSEQAD